MKDFIKDYVAVKGEPPFLALQIKNHGAYTLHPNSIDHSKRNIPPIREVPVGNQKDSDVVHSPTEEDFEKLACTTDPTELLFISDKEQFKFKYTIEDKKGRPFYEYDPPAVATKDDSTKDDKKEDGTSEDDASDDDQKKRKFLVSFTPRRIVAPPEYPFAYYRVKKNKECPHCHGIGKECHNIRYGSYLTAVVVRYYREHEADYNEFDAACRNLSTQGFSTLWPWVSPSHHILFVPRPGSF